MSRKDEKIAATIQALEGHRFDPHYVGFFECFNRQLFFEAHEVLEASWLKQRGTPKDLFYKGLIQLAGAFVHIQKNRQQPALALFRLAQHNLGKYPSGYESLDLDKVQKLISAWIESLERKGPLSCLVDRGGWPVVSLEPADGIE